jgi:hypothetical protein
VRHVTCAGAGRCPKSGQGVGEIGLKAPRARRLALLSRELLGGR